MKRQPWDDYFLKIASVVKDRSTCKKRRVGAVFVTKDNHILTTGYNGSLSGEDHCLDKGCVLDANNKCLRTIHAEVNGIAQAAKIGISLKGSQVFITREPCYNCFKLLVQSGIARIVFLTPTNYELTALNAILAKKLNIWYEPIRY